MNTLHIVQRITDKNALHETSRLVKWHNGSLPGHLSAPYIRIQHTTGLPLTRGTRDSVAATFDMLRLWRSEVPQLYTSTHVPNTAGSREII
jgi:hypothetical protein